jgi:hypothetical protein
VRLDGNDVLGAVIGGAGVTRRARGLVASYWPGPGFFKYDGALRRLTHSTCPGRSAVEPNPGRVFNVVKDLVITSDPFLGL